jgi:LmbE family N-acetylglucosaminyl deacetylase
MRHPRTRGLPETFTGEDDVGEIYEQAPGRALVIAAHPDDIEFVVAGTAAKWVRAGARVRYVLVTNGDAGSHDPRAKREEIARVRVAETKAAAETAGVEEVVFFGYPDGEVEPTLKLRRDIVREIRRFKPDVFVCPDPTQLFVRGNYVNHPDHRAVGLAALDAACPTSAMPLIFPELADEGFTAHRAREVMVATRTEPNCWVDIAETIDTKIQALLCHRSQFSTGWNPEPMVREWAAECGAPMGLSHAETYRRIVWPRP